MFVWLGNKFRRFSSTWSRAAKKAFDWLPVFGDDLDKSRRQPARPESESP